MKNFDYKFLKNILYLSCSIVFFLSFQTFAAGGLTGKVFDKETNEILPGANVIVDVSRHDMDLSIKSNQSVLSILHGNLHYIVSLHVIIIDIMLFHQLNLQIYIQGLQTHLYQQ